MRGDNTFERILFLVCSTCCTCGFMYGTQRSWQKFQSEPISAVTSEVECRNRNLPSITVCTYSLSTVTQRYSRYNLFDMRKELNIEVASVVMGWDINFCAFLLVTSQKNALASTLCFIIILDSSFSLLLFYFRHKVLTDEYLSHFNISMEDLLSVSVRPIPTLGGNLLLCYTLDPPDTSVMPNPTRTVSYREYVYWCSAS